MKWRPMAHMFVAMLSHLSRQENPQNMWSETKFGIQAGEGEGG